MMKGRIEDKIKYERKIQEKIKDMPSFIVGYYYYLSEKTYMTKKTYLNNVIRFLEWYGNGDLNSITTEKLNRINVMIIQQYVMSIQYIGDNKELGDDAKSGIYSCINSFMTYLKNNGIIQDNPFDGKRISRPKAHDNDVIFLEPEEYAKIKVGIMSGVGNDRAKAKQKKWMYRDLLLFQIPIITGVRVTALSQISINDIDFEKKYISVVDKARDKKLYLDDETMWLIQIWLTNRKEILNGEDDCGYLFISNRKQKMSPSTIEAVIEKYTQCVSKHITPHKLRSTCGTNAYRATKDIYLVAEILGHKSTSTTRKYTKVDDNDRINAAELVARQMKA